MADVSVEITEQVLQFETQVAQIPADQVAVLEGIKKEVQVARQSAEESAGVAEVVLAEVRGKATGVDQQAQVIADDYREITALAKQVKQSGDTAAQASHVAVEAQRTVTTLHGEVEQAWSGINRASLISIAADLIRTQALIIEHGVRP